MLMKNTGATTYVCDTQERADKISQAGFSATLIGELKPLANDGYVVIANDIDAIVAELIASGVADTDISTVSPEALWEHPVADARALAVPVRDERVRPFSEAGWASYE